jgi:hypothetical protein
MDASLYLYLTVAVSLFVTWDATRRGATRLGWAVATVIAWPIMLPIWMTTLPLRAGEVRRGGRASNLLRQLALAWSILWGSHLVVAAGVGVVVATTEQDRSGRDSGLSMVILIAVILAAIWLVPALGALLLGWLLRRPDVAEHGPHPTAITTP